MNGPFREYDSEGNWHCYRCGDTGVEVYRNMLGWEQTFPCQRCEHMRNVFYEQTRYNVPDISRTVFPGHQKAYQKGCRT